MRTALRQATVIVLLSLLPALATALWHPRRPAWESDEVTVGAARAWGGSVLWVDARPVDDYKRGHIPGALPLDEDRWDEMLHGVLDQWDTTRKVVVYCSNSLTCDASRDVAMRLRQEENLPNVFVLHGGWEAWQKENR